MPSTSSVESYATSSSIKEVTSNTSALIILRLFSRIVTLVLNTIVIRLTSPLVLGIATTKLELFYNTIIYLSREGLRMALLRYKPNDQKEWLRRLFHMSWLTIPYSFLPLFATLFAYAATIPKEVEPISSRFWLAIFIYTIAALIELISEPFHMICVHSQQWRSRIKVDSIALTLRAATVLLICLFYRQKGHDSLLIPRFDMVLMAFPLGQLIYSLAVSLGLYRIARKIRPEINLMNLLPFPEIQIDNTICDHAINMTKQVLLKYVLAQGDMWIISLITSLKDQGVYTVVTNYGSLICRIILQPIEEIALSFFSRHPPITSMSYLFLMLKFNQLLSLIIFVFGWTMTRPVIGSILGAKWLDTQASWALSIYCLLLPAMAFSGILETFVHGTMHKDWLKFYQWTSISFTVIYIGIASILTVFYGPVGLIVANILNFAARIITNSYYLTSFAKEHQLVLPKGSFAFRPSFYFLFMILFILFNITKNLMGSDSLVDNHSLFVIAMMPITALLIFRLEREFVGYLKAVFVDSQTKTK